MEKKRSEVVQRLMSKLTPEYLEEMKKKRIEHKNSLSSEWQLGFYVGENIIHNDLPTISVESGTRRVIEVSLEDKNEYKNTEENWYKKYFKGKDEAEEEWKIYQQCRKKLIKKYLPDVLKCYMRFLNITNMSEFKNGLINSLWNSDVCSYSLNPEDINIYDDNECYFTIIELKLK
jgi:hypothetical protein